MSPEDLFAPFAAPLLGVLLWVSAGIGAAMTLYIAVVGIRKGLSWFFAIVEERKTSALLAHFEAGPARWDYPPGDEGEAAFQRDNDAHWARHKR